MTSVASHTPRSRQKSSVQPLERTTNEIHQSGKPFLYFGHYYKLFISLRARTDKEASLGYGEPIPEIFVSNNLKYRRVYVPGPKPHIGFVEVEEKKDGLRAIEKLHGR